MGQGAAQAIEDACALGVVLPLGTPPEDVPQRLELWQRLRKDRAYKIVENTRHRSRRADGSDGPPQTCEFRRANSFFPLPSLPSPPSPTTQLSPLRIHFPISDEKVSWG